MSLVGDVVALYVDPRGPYPSLVREWYDAERNAMAYRGTLPVVAHPPCGPWANLRHLHAHAKEIGLAPHAVATVQRVGGVLEHPARSALWDACGLPKPLVGDPAFEIRVPCWERIGTGFRSLYVSVQDHHGGYTIEVAQCDWGHPARKRTWLYVVGCPWYSLPPVPPPREPTHWVSGGRTPSNRRGSPVPPGIKVCSAQQRRRSPPAFARWLVDIARSAARKERAA